jgi:cell wall-associated NlpC family hydrolase
VNGFGKRQLVTLLIAAPALAVLLALATSASADPTVESKRAEARQALAQIDEMDRQLEVVVERYNGATWHLKQTEAELGRTRNSLRIARNTLGQARHILARRVISLYMEEGDPSSSTVAIVLGANSVQDVLDRLEAEQRVSDHDARVVTQVKRFGEAVAEREAKLEKARTVQQQLVNEISSEKASVERKLAARKAYYNSVKNEIASLIQQERREAQARATAAQRALASGGSLGPTSASSSDDIPAPPASSVGGRVVQIAMQYLGHPYQWGAAGPDAFDCSGLVVYVFAQVGISLPHYTGDLWAGGVPVGRGDLQPGDLVFFYGIGHVGIYIGGDQFIHAPHTGDVVKISSLNEGSYASSYDGARRYGT